MIWKKFVLRITYLKTLFRFEMVRTVEPQFYILIPNTYKLPLQNYVHNIRGKINLLEAYDIDGH